jgi:hypothetical protein
MAACERPGAEDERTDDETETGMSERSCDEKERGRGSGACQPVNALPLNGEPVNAEDNARLS